MSDLGSLFFIIAISLFVIFLLKWNNPLSENKKRSSFQKKNIYSGMMTNDSKIEPVEQEKPQEKSFKSIKKYKESDTVKFNDYLKKLRTETYNKPPASTYRLQSDQSIFLLDDVLKNYTKIFNKDFNNHKNHDYFMRTLVRKSIIYMRTESGSPKKAIEFCIETFINQD